MHAHAKKPWHSTTQWRGALAPVSCSRVRRVAASIPDVDAHGALNRCSLLIDWVSWPTHTSRTWDVSAQRGGLHVGVVCHAVDSAVYEYGYEQWRGAFDAARYVCVG